ncbi:undecaprenyl/decaprenyl-phosphate alpha-N-acetylglucosaminyl 1-phosphate transferase [bacterium]|nr:undecaprenyl/decaprenyl-phosphate alpha-N-acetylglucosaminyl 1-phosphate transferase [bacterium]
MDIYLLSGLVSLVLALLLTPWVGILAKRFGAIQESPQEALKKIQEQREKGLSDRDYESKLQAARRRLDKPPMIMWGGLGYVVPFLVVSGVVLLISKNVNIPVSDFSTYMLWFSSIVILLVVGMIDDVFELTGRVQFMFHIVAAIVLVLLPIDFKGFTIPFGLGYANMNWWQVTPEVIPWLSFVFPGDLLLFLWVLPLINAIKWVAGNDGLMEGDIGIAAIILFLVSFNFNQSTSALLSITLAGALFGFLYYNFFPSKIISGSTGKTPLGFIIAGIALIDTSKIAITLIVFALPLVDAFWVLLRRFFYYKPKSLLQLMLISNQYHFHFHLRKLGFTERQVALFEYAYILFWGLLGVFVPPEYKSWVLLFALLTSASLIISVTAKTYDQ